MKKFVIVCDEKCRKYGDYLAQLVSVNDDTAEETVGTKDGEVLAQVWTEEDFESNAVQIASSQYILFIGNTPLIKTKGAYMEPRFSEYGIRYGWLGKQAVLSVESGIKDGEKKFFFEFAGKYQVDLTKRIEEKTKGKSVNMGKVAAMAGFVPFGFIPAAMMSAKKISQDKEVSDLQYSCGVVKFYLEELSTFLEM